MPMTTFHTQVEDLPRMSEGTIVVSINDLRGGGHVKRQHNALQVEFCRSHAPPYEDPVSSPAAGSEEATALATSVTLKRLSPNTRRV